MFSFNFNIFQYNSSHLLVYFIIECTPILPPKLAAYTANSGSQFSSDKGRRAWLRVGEHHRQHILLLHSNSDIMLPIIKNLLLYTIFLLFHCCQLLPIQYVDYNEIHKSIYHCKCISRLQRNTSQYKHLNLHMQRHHGYYYYIPSTTNKDSMI